MTIFQMLGQSGILTLLGMAVVFSFLIILVLAMKFLHMAVRVLGLEKFEAQESQKSAQTNPAAFSNSDANVAAISVALFEKNAL